MTDLNALAERLERQVSSDHDRGCDGRCYACSCGYDGAKDELLRQAAQALRGMGMLTDPAVVHINMLRGGIAKLTPAQIGHTYRGDEAVQVIAEVIRQSPAARSALKERGGLE